MQDKPNFEELGVLDEDIVYDDTDFRFDISKFKKYDDELEKKILTLISLCRAKSHGEEVDEYDVLALALEAEQSVSAELRKQNTSE